MPSSSVLPSEAPTPRLLTDSALCHLVAEPELRANMPPADTWLTPSETARLANLGSAARRDSFLAGRWQARRTVQLWLGSDEIPALDVADSGACLVVGLDGVHVSISHSAGFVACAAGGVPLGIDLEGLARPRDHLALAGLVHGPAQQDHLARLPADARAVTFLQWWTLKEAWLKARGLGLDFALMRSLNFEADAALGDVAVTRFGDLVLALAGNPKLPQQIDGLPQTRWQWSRSRILA